MEKPLNLIWFKRDLRWQDHAPLKAAIERQEKLLALFVFEDFYPKDPSWSIRHWQAQYQSLLDMFKQEKAVAQELLVLEGNVLNILAYIQKLAPINTIFSYQESGEALSYQRDKAVNQFCMQNGIVWQEFPSNGVQRGIKNRAHWDESWRQFMDQEQAQPQLNKWPKASLKLKQDLKERFAISSHLRKQISYWPSGFQAMGESAAQARLHNFIEQGHYRYYAQHIGEPYLSRSHCSRLSPFLAWGNLSLKQVFQQAWQARKNAQSPRDLRAFISRLHWHSHFIQKFEMEGRMEFENLNRAFNELKKERNEIKIEAWKKGETGFPLVDACMRALEETGYINFRMRALMVSFLCHHLWQDWQEGVHHLAQLFLDYIPGIHFPQFQMQNGSTGINTIRIYNPVKQSLEKDPEGRFLDQFLPELKELPLAFKHQPWLMTAMEQSFYNFELGRDYPQPLIDLTKSGNHARDVLWAFRKSPAVQTENIRILKKHTTALRDPQLRSTKIMQD